MRGRALFFCALWYGAATAFAQLAPATEPLTRIAFGSCNREYRPQVLWKPILACDPQVWIWLGDIVYGEADRLDDLARRYRSAKAQPDYAILRTRAHILGVWDDNDFGVSNGGAENAHKRQSQQLLLDFLDEPADSPRRQQAGVYTAATFGPPGKQVKIILLDGRYHRTEPPGWWSWILGKTETASDILGAEQWRWLEQQLTNSPADLHLIGSGIQVIPTEHRYEKWADFPHARQRLLDLLARTQPRNVIFLSGDRHLGEISRLVDPRFPAPLYDITSSGLTHHATSGFFHDFKAEPNRYRMGKNYLALNFGLLQVDWAASPPLLTAQIRGVDNVVALEEKIPLTPAPASLPATP